MDELRMGDMIAMQRELYAKHRETWSPLEPKYARNSLLWMIGEIGEVTQLIKKLGEDRIAQDSRARGAFVEEMVDVLMYYNDVLMRYGISGEELSEAYAKKHTKNMGRDYDAERRNFLTEK